MFTEMNGYLKSFEHAHVRGRIWPLPNIRGYIRIHVRENLRLTTTLQVMHERRGIRFGYSAPKSMHMSANELCMNPEKP
jgi:hypothetical protein